MRAPGWHHPDAAGMCALPRCPRQPCRGLRCAKARSVRGQRRPAASERWEGAFPPRCPAPSGERLEAQGRGGKGWGCGEGKAGGLHHSWGGREQHCEEGISLRPAVQGAGEPASVREDEGPVEKRPETPLNPIGQQAKAGEVSSQQWVPIRRKCRQIQEKCYPR